jgi:hypothetical protein
MTTNRSVLRRLTSQGMLDMFEGVDPRFDWTLGYQKGGELFHEEDFLEGDALHLGSGGAILRGSSPLSGKPLRTILSANRELSTWGGASKRTNNEREEARGQFLVTGGVQVDVVVPKGWVV